MLLMERQFVQSPVVSRGQDAKAWRAALSAQPGMKGSGGTLAPQQHVSSTDLSWCLISKLATEDQ